LILFAITAGIRWFFPVVWEKSLAVMPCLMRGLGRSVFVPIWIVITTAAFVLISFHYWFQRFRKPAWQRKYKQDEFFKIIWRWEYNSDGAIIYLRSFCIKCDMEISLENTYSQSGAFYICGRCTKADSIDGMRSWDIQKRVEKLIEANIRDGSWKKRKI
jgi:hypothetical protein